jgi:addiction module HigA family antidote
MASTPNRAIRPTHPGAVLKSTVLPALKISAVQAARDLGISRAMLYKVMDEKAAITPEMAIRIGKFCGNGPELWLGMQQAVDLWDARQKLGAEIDKIPTKAAA